MSAAKQEPKDVEIYMKNGDMISGKLTSIDKVKLLITIIQATKHFKEDQTKTETFESLEIKKEDIQEIKLIKYNTKPEQKKLEENSMNVNAIPENKIPQMSDQMKGKCYDKNESFFDNLEVASKGNVKTEAKNYNERNKDTFNLPNEPEQRYQHYQHRRGYQRGGHQNNQRGYHQRGGRGRNFQQQGFNNYNNGNQFQQGNHRGRGWNNRRGRGQHFNRGGHSNNPNPNPNFDTSKLQRYQPEGGIKPEIEKSIYDN